MLVLDLTCATIESEWAISCVTLTMKCFISLGDLVLFVACLVRLQLNSCFAAHIFNLELVSLSITNQKPLQHSCACLVSVCVNKKPFSKHSFLVATQCLPSSYKVRAECSTNIFAALPVVILPFFCKNVIGTAAKVFVDHPALTFA